MYINEDLSVNNTQHVSLKNVPGLRLPLSSNRSGTKKSSSPFVRRRGTHMALWAGLRTPKHIHHSTLERKSKHIRLHALSLTVVDFFCQGFEWFCLDKRLVHLHKHTLVFFFFSYIFIYIIHYGSLSQFVLRHHAGEGRGVDGRR